MTSISSLTLFASVVACGIMDCYGTIYPNIYYINDRCDEVIVVQGDARIKLASTPTLPPDKQCYLTFQTDSGIELKAFFLSYDMNVTYVSETGECTIESIQLYDAAGTSQLGSSEDYCSRARPSSNFYLGSVGRLRFTTEQYSDIWTAGVDLLVSEVNPISSFNYSTCPSTDFDCDNNYCISKDLTCNGFDDCGNNDDESDDKCDFYTPPGYIGGIVAGVVFVIVVICIISFIVYKRRKRADYTQHI